MSLVAFTGATLSFTSLAGLGRACGYGSGLSWLLPLSIDAYAFVGTRVWLSGPVDRRVTRWAAVSGWLAIAASIVGNATFHAISTGHGARMVDGRAQANVWIVVLVGAAPAVFVGAVVSLLHLARHATLTTGPAQETDPALVEPVKTPAPAKHTPPVESAMTAANSTAASVRRPGPGAGGRAAGGERAPARREGASAKDQLRHMLATEVPVGDERSVSELARDLAPRAGCAVSSARKTISLLLAEQRRQQPIQEQALERAYRTVVPLNAAAGGAR